MIFYAGYDFFYDFVLTNRSTFENDIINLQVLTSSKFLSAIGYDVYFNENIISIDGARAVQIKSECNFFKYLNIFLFFIISFPSNIKRMFKYIFIILFYLSFTQIFRVASFAVYIKYFPEYWIVGHLLSTYLFYYPGILLIWYFFSKKNYIFDLAK